MIKCWNDLGLALEMKGDWTDAQRSLALDLLGAHPATRECSLELPPDATVDDKWSVIAAQVSRLEAERDEFLAELDEEERINAMQGNSFDVSQAAERLRRYEAATMRVFFRLLHHFQGRIKSLRRKIKPIDVEEDECGTVPDPAPNPVPAAAASPAKPKSADFGMESYRRALAAFEALGSAKPAVSPSVPASVSEADVAVSVSKPIATVQPAPQPARTDRRARRNRNRRR